MKYFIELSANLRGALGQYQDFSRSVDAENFAAARLALADEFDHVRVKTVNGEKFDPMNPPE